MEYIKLAEELIEFNRKSGSMFHSIENIKNYMEEAGYTYLNEGEEWKLEKGKAYYTTRNGSSLIAFKIGSDLTDYHFQMTAAHSDSPTYKVKSVPELEGPDDYLRLNVESYGGVIDSTWLDKPLTLAGRVLVKNKDKVESKLLYIDKDILLIPNQPIHFNRDMNDGYKFDRQVDLCPLFSAGELEKGAYDKMIADEMGVAEEDIIAKDLFLVNRQEGKIWGVENEFISTPKLDDLECAFSAMKAFIAAKNDKAINVYACFDNEEVGSNTKQGAMSTFLHDVLKRINNNLGYEEEDYFRAISKSFLVSCDNAHALHPNHKEKYDEENRTYMNGGIVIKEAANQKYTSDAFSQAVFKTILNKADVPYQNFANKSNIMGGSTLGNLSNTQVSLHAVDMGLAQIAMHSNYETGGAKDVYYAVKGLEEFYNTNIKIDSAHGFEIE